MDHLHGMAPPPEMKNATVMPPKNRHRMMMHMSFYWGNEAFVLFTGWPGSRHDHYAGCLVLVFVLGFLVEFLSHCKLIKDGSNRPVVLGIIKTLMHVVRMGLAYTVMLAVMSFNVGVFLAAVLGHALGFFIFGSRAFSRSPLSSDKTSDLPPMNC